MDMPENEIKRIKEMRESGKKRNNWFRKVCVNNAKRTVDKLSEYIRLQYIRTEYNTM